ncbi:uncharacterized protein LOC123527180 isoform X3 [Mercenaria mercenaria]|uniref:uncharacterized protein LOC123527180 isoform X3 n=1 Tax=Mercenaria mercenaria TaxID=6596 RepID=UPI00234F16EB|nr:uncharacterized protein LOC123527180 isoform X3 [Mercenaria mercenaria]
MPHDPYLSNPRYKNWVKGGLATKFLREGIVDLVDWTTKRQHYDMLADIKKVYGERAVAGYTSCSLKTLMPIHTKTSQGTCSLGQKHHCNCLNPKGKQLCPTKFCSAMYDKIIAQHRFGTPSWKNTDISQWHNNHWQIAKCNIPAGESVGKMSAYDTDYSGLINVMVNDLEMQTELSYVVDPPHDVISKARKARNDIFHSTDLELDDHTVRMYLNDMISILDDRICIRSEAQTAKTKLEQLRDDTLEITIADEMEMRKASLKAMREKECEILENLEARKNEIISDLNLCVLQNINDQCASLSTREEYEELKSLIESIDTKINSVKDGLSVPSTHDGDDQDTLIKTIQSQVDTLNDKVVTMEDFQSQNKSINDQLRILSDQLEELRKPLKGSSDTTETSQQSTEWIECLGNTAKTAAQLNQELRKYVRFTIGLDRNVPEI